MSNVFQQLLAIDVENLDKMAKELRPGAKLLSRSQILGVVKTYYQIQDVRKACEGVVRAVSPDDLKIIAIKEDPDLTKEQMKAKIRLIEKEEEYKIAEKARRKSLFTAYVSEQMEMLENQLKKIMGDYADHFVTGQWSRSICGIDGVLSAGLLAYIDMDRCPTVGHIWRYAGYDPTIEWLGRQKASDFFASQVGARGSADEDTILKIAAKLNISPTVALDNMNGLSRKDQISYLSKPHHNADFKVLCWKIGDCFNKIRNNEDGFYGRLIAIRTAYEQEKNERGEYAERAAKMLASKNVIDAKLKKTYESGRIPDGQIFNSAKRYAVKIFLSHWHAVAHQEFRGGPAPKPFAISILGHAHEVPVPNWPY